MTTEFANCAVPEVLGRIVLQLLVDYPKFTSLGVTRLFMRERGARRQRGASGDDLWRAPLDCARSPSNMLR